MVKRYWMKDVDEGGFGIKTPYMAESPDGTYVRHDDYAALEAECARLKELMKEAHSFWCEYSSYGESTQDDMNDERFAMLTKMAVIQPIGEPT